MHEYPCSISCPDKKRHCILTCEKYQEVKNEVVTERIEDMKKGKRYSEVTLTRRDKELKAAIQEGRI